MKQIKYTLIIPIVLLLSACSKKDAPILTYEQNLTAYTTNVSDFNITKETFDEKYFMPWQISKIAYPIEKATWANQVFYKKDRYYGENTLLLDIKEIEDIINKTNFKAYNTINHYAITTKNAQVRNLPTNKPFLKNTKDAGEGFSFDYLQNTRLHVNTPLLISHYSLDGAWAFIQSESSTGWIGVENIALVDAKNINEFKNAQKIVVIKDNIPLYDLKNRFVTYVKLGAIFANTSQVDDKYISYMYKNDIEGNAQKIAVYIPTAFAKSFPLDFQSNNILTIGNELLNEKYGWGGFMANRDCSAMTKDFFAPFGIWLPRNSFSQSQAGEFISFENMSDTQKEQKILEVGIPFVSLIYLKGHIMLYIGQQDSKAMVMHNTWGLKIQEGDNVGRKVIGKSIISDLYLGKNQEDIIEETLLIKKALGILVKPSLEVKETNPFLKAYKSITKVENNSVYFDDNSTLAYDDFSEKSFEEMLENADIEDMIKGHYKAFEEITPPLDDVGRARNEALFHKLYGQDAKEIKANLEEVTWVDGSKLYFNKKQNASVQLQKVITELSKLPNSYNKYITNIAGTYNHRYISGTKRLSAHSFGIAIDLNVAQSRYWKWDKKYAYSNNFPKAIIDIFERYGFIWGGRWYHYDTMHFEYRPELFFKID